MLHQPTAAVAERSSTATNRIAVIICAYTEKRWDDLVAAVESVRQQTLPADEIIVVIDHNPALLERARTALSSSSSTWTGTLKVVENTGVQGLSAARNSGITATTAEMLAFLDDDAFADVHWLERLSQEIDKPNVLGVGGRILPVWEGGNPGWLPEEFYWVVGSTHRGVPTETAEIRNLVGASMLIRREAFDAAGGFRSEIGRVGTIPLGCEETEFCIRARQTLPGSKFVYVPEALVHHRVPQSRAQWSYFWSRCYAEGVSKAVVSRFVGSKDGLSAERSHVMKTLPQGVLTGLKDTVQRRNINGLLRAFAIIAGLLVTVMGYARGKLSRTSLPTAKPSLQNLSPATVSNHPMRILMVSARYYPLSGGTETHVYEVAKRLAADGQDVTVLTTDRTGELPREEVRDGVTIKRVKAWPKERDYYFAPGLYRVITGGNWDVVHLQGYHTLVAPLAMLAALRAKIPYAVTFHSGGHSSSFRNSGRSIQYRLLKPLLKRATQLIGVSQFEADFFAEQLGVERSRFEVIPNGAHLPTLDQPVERDTPPLIVSSGRLERYKGHHHVIAALAKVHQMRPDVKLRIAGVGPYEDELRTLVSNLGLTSHVEIEAVPATNRQGMAELLSRASLIVLFSEYEAHPVAVMEALSLKRPVLVADTSGLHELAVRGLVQAVPLDRTPDQLAWAMIQQLDQPLIPENIHLPTWEECAASLLAVYQNMDQPPAGAQPFDKHVQIAPVYSR